MKALKIILMLTLAAGLLSFAGCDDDDDFYQAIIEYDLTVQNNADVAYDIFLANTADDEPYDLVGQVEANGTTTLDNLIAGVYYTVRVSLVGDSSDDYVAPQYSVRSVDGHNQTLEVN